MTNEKENVVQVGDIVLTSSTISISELLGYLLMLLKEKDIKNYLGIIKKNNHLKGGLGIG